MPSTSGEGPRAAGYDPSSPRQEPRNGRSLDPWEDFKGKGLSMTGAAEAPAASIHQGTVPSSPSMTQAHLLAAAGYILFGCAQVPRLASLP